MVNVKPISAAPPKDAQVCVRIPTFIDEWLEKRARKSGSKADVVRSLIEQEMAREEEVRLRAMFDAAAVELTREEREDRDQLLGAFEAEED
jgi:hypothetical protein